MTINKLIDCLYPKYSLKKTSEKFGARDTLRNVLIHTGQLKDAPLKSIPGPG